MTIKQTLPSHIVVAQIYSAVLTSLTQRNGWCARPEGDVDAIVPRPCGSVGPVRGETVSFRVLGVNAANGAVVSTLVQGKTITIA